MYVGLSSDAQYVTNQTLATVSRQLSALGLLTSKGVVFLYNKQQTAAGIGLKRETIKSDAWTHVQACVCAERILSGRQWIDRWSPELRPPPRWWVPHKLNSPDQLTPHIALKASMLEGASKVAQSPSLQDFFLDPPTSSTLQDQLTTTQSL